MNGLDLQVTKRICIICKRQSRLLSLLGLETQGYGDSKDTLSGRIRHKRGRPFPCSPPWALCLSQ